MTVFGVGQVDDPKGDNSMFSFVRGDYPNVVVNYQERESGVMEPSQLGPYPLIETEHPYQTNKTRAWSVTYMNDPANPGRNITGLRLKANPNEVQIDSGDQLMISGWLENQKRYQNLAEILPANILSNYTNGVNTVFSQPLPTTTIGLFFSTGPTTPTPGMDFGFRVSGVRYDFDSDTYPVYFETPHPYDTIIGATDPADLNIQVIYSPYQASPGDPGFFQPADDDSIRQQILARSGRQPVCFQFQRPRLGCPCSRLHGCVAASSGRSACYYKIGSGTASGLSASPVPALGGRQRRHSELRLQSQRDAICRWAGRHAVGSQSDDPKHAQPVPRANIKSYNLPGSMPFGALGGLSLAAYQTIYEPAVPDKDDPTGLGSVDDWSVSFTDSSDLTATSGASNNDVIRLTTSGNPLVAGLDQIYFVNPGGAFGPLIGTDPHYFDVADLQNYVAHCGTADKLEIEFDSDNVDAYQNSLAVTASTRRRSATIRRTGSMTIRLLPPFVPMSISR